MSLRFPRLLLILLACSPALSLARPKPKSGAPLDVFLSAGDSWWAGTWLPVDSPASIRDTVQMWSDVVGMKRIYWRGEQEEMMIDYGLIRKDNLQYYDFIKEWEGHLVKDLKLNQVLVTEAHRHGIEVYLWSPLFDYGGPADNGGCKEYPYYGQLNLTIQHPEWMPEDRYGIRHQNGPIELAYPGARKALIDIYLHYIDRDKLDGITFFTYCENYGLRFEDEFGYSQPIVDEYKRRYGVDIRTQDFDRHLWHYLRGEYVTQFLRELKAELVKRHKKLGVRLNPREPNMTDRWNVPAYFLTSGRIYMDWEKWVREGIVDQLDVSGTTPHELQNRTLDNVLQATEGKGIACAVQANNPDLPRYKPYIARGLRMTLFEVDTDSYLRLAYSDVPASALQGDDLYAAIHFMAEVADGKATIDSGRIVPWVKHPNVLARREALRALGHLRDPASIPVLEAALHDPERCVRCSAIFALLQNHGPESVTRLIEAVRRSGEFQIFESASTVLTKIDPSYLPEIRRLASDQDANIRRMGLYVLGRRGDAASMPPLIAGLKDQDLYARFRAICGLQAYFGDSQARQAMIAALDDESPVIQDRAAISLAIATVKGCTIPPRHGLESSVKMLDTKTGPLPAIALDSTQQGVLEALVKKFREFGDASSRSDLDWGFRPIGNSILAFGTEGGRRLQGLIDQRSDRRLAELAWQVLYIRQGIENFCRVSGEEAGNAAIYATYPTRQLSTVEGPSPIPYNPLDKDD